MSLTEESLNILKVNQLCTNAQPAILMLTKREIIVVKRLWKRMLPLICVKEKFVVKPVMDLIFPSKVTAVRTMHTLHAQPKDRLIILSQ